MTLVLYILPVIVLGMLWLLFKFYFNSSKNPFKFDSRIPPKPHVTDQKERDAVLRQFFQVNKVPEKLDAIVIGSGIGGLSVAALLSKAGKKVLVLEQHDKAGGCCHTFVKKGYEFDVGIHYIGEMHFQSLPKTYLDQISDGQIQWEPLADAFDNVIFRDQDGAASRHFQILSNVERQKELLKTQFPGEEKGIDRYYDLVDEAYNGFKISYILKLIPLWLVKILVRLNLANKLFRFCQLNETTLKETVDELTSNQTLRDIFCYTFGNYGTLPTLGGFAMQGIITAHFGRGASYPVGGPSQIPFNIIQVIERGGGKVLVKAEISEILLNSRRHVEGVKIRHDDQEIKISAPLVISSAGLPNTFLKFLPKDVTRESRLFPFLHGKAGPVLISVYVGLNGTPEELGIPTKTNYWIFAGNDFNKLAVDYLNTPKEAFENNPIPIIYMAFSSTKDPTWQKRYPGKTTLFLGMSSHYNWFEEWEKKPHKERGDEYENFMKSISQRLIDEAIAMFPVIKDRIDFVGYGSPLDKNYYIGKVKGKVYGIEHDQTRFRPLNSATLRPTTDIPGLYLSGQDISTCGFIGALMGGLMCAQQILGWNVFLGLMKLHQKIVVAGNKEKKE